MMRKQMLWCVVSVALLMLSAAWPHAVAANEESNDCIAAATVVVKMSAALRAGPGTSYAQSRVVASNTVLQVVSYQHDGHGCWYQVEYQNLLAWIAGSTVAPRADTAAASTPAAAPTPITKASSEPTAPVVGPPAGDPETTNHLADSTGTDTFVPGSNGRVATPVDWHITVRVCLDTNANQFCDVGDGISAMPVFALDGVTGTILTWGRTDRDGVLQLSVRALPNATITINIPYLGTFDTISAPGQAVTRTVPFTPALPGLIP